MKGVAAGQRHGRTAGADAGGRPRSLARHRRASRGTSWRLLLRASCRRCGRRGAASRSGRHVTPADGALPAHAVHLSVGRCKRAEGSPRGRGQCWTWEEVSRHVGEAVYGQWQQRVQHGCLQASRRQRAFRMSLTTVPASRLHRRGGVPHSLHRAHKRPAGGAAAGQVPECGSPAGPATPDRHQTAAGPAAAAGAVLGHPTWQACTVGG